MSNQIVITSGAKVRSLEGVITGTSGVLSSVPLGAAGGVATLDSGGKVPVSQLPSSVVTYLGTWDASTNTPTLANGTGDAGDMYICNVAGTVNFGAGPITFAVGDWVLYGSGTWQKSNGQNGTVTSVAASITGNSIGITGSPITTAGTLAFAFAGNSGQYINGAGNLVTFPTITAEATRLITEVYNETGATLSKGTIVYINGGHGNLPTVTKAIATGDSTSAQTYGVVQSDITDNNNGYVVVIGSLGDLDTQAYANGTQLYLSGTTAGAWTSTKPSAPIHLVYVAVVVRSHPTQGVVEVRIQNGYELDELHDVAISTPLNNQGIFYNSTSHLWENKSIATALGYTPANDALVVHLAGTETITGAKTFSSAIIGDGAIKLKNGVAASGSGYVGLGSNAGEGLTLGIYNSGTVYYQDLFFPITNGYQYTFPASSGTIALTSALSNYVDLTTAQTIGGTKTFTDATKNNGGIFLQNGSSSSLAGYMNVGGLTNGVKFTSGGGISNSFLLPSATGYSFTFPNATGTIALTSDLSSYLPLTGGTVNGQINIDNGIALKENTSYSSVSGYVNITASSSPGTYYQLSVINYAGAIAGLRFVNSGSYTYTFPNASGTIALVGGSGVGTVTSVAALTIGTSGTDLSSTVANSTTTPVITLNVPTASATNRGALSSADWTTFNNKQNALTNPVTASGSWTSGYLPKINGTYTIGNSIVQDDGTTVTIGNNLKVIGNSSNTIGAIRIQGATSDYQGISLYYAASGAGASSRAWQIAPNYTANGNLEFLVSSSNTTDPTNSKLTLFSDGNLGLGTTTNASYKLDVNGTGRFSGNVILGTVADDGNKLQVNGSAFVKGGNSLYLGNNTNANYWGIQSAGTGATALTFEYNSGASLLSIASTGAATFSSSVTATQGKFINAASNFPLTIDNSTQGYVAQEFKSNGVTFGYIGNANTLNSSGSVTDMVVRSENALILSSASTERMRILSGGAVCIGVTSPYGSNLLNVNGGIYATSSIAAVVASDIDMFVFQNTGASYTKACMVASIAATGGTGSYFFYGQQSTSTVALKIFSNGNIQNTNNSYGAISDARLKENISDATPKLEDLMKVKVRNYNLKGESNKQLGVISQELEQIFPNMIEESSNIGSEVKIKGVKYSVFVPMLIKAVQELKAEIETLKNK